MIEDVRQIIAQSPHALARDAFGVVAIGVLTIVTLFLPSFF